MSENINKRGEKKEEKKCKETHLHQIFLHRSVMPSGGCRNMGIL
jgi:hypothetical protein